MLSANKILKYLFTPKVYLKRWAAKFGGKFSFL